MSRSYDFLTVKGIADYIKQRSRPFRNRDLFTLRELELILLHYTVGVNRTVRSYAHDVNTICKGAHVNLVNEIALNVVVFVGLDHLSFNRNDFNRHLIAVLIGCRESE